MALDEHDWENEHSVELVNEPKPRAASARRSFATLAVALCLTLSGAAIVLGIAHTQRLHDEQRALDSAQREDLRQGWQTLSAAAAQEAVANEALSQAAQAPAPPSATPAPPTNIVIVNVPGQPVRSSSTVSAPQVGSSTAAVPAPTRANIGSVSTIYVPTPIPAQGTAPSGVPDQTVGNGTIPGSQPNPALPNGSPGAAPSPALPNGNANVTPPTPSLPSATTPVSPPASPPSGFNF